MKIEVLYIDGCPHFPAAVGSPSVRIDGLDIEPSARQRTAFGMMCRTYESGGVPSEDLIRSAITTAAAISST
jgi:hypothetical protein